MRERWAGPAVVLLVFAAVLVILALNLNPKGPATRAPNDAGSSSPPVAAPTDTQNAARQPAGFREYPIGDEIEINGMLISAVYLPPVQMEGMAESVSSSLIHLEADVKATESNRHGFSQYEKVPYLVVRYRIIPRDATTNGKIPEPLEGRLWPMMARDGFHYGANIEMPSAGRYRLIYRFEPPSAGGLGRHADRATGVDPWWKPFDISFDWDYPGPPRPEP
jgi:uncharacterized protein involved in high-affinity Fe2+ transport